MRTCQGKNSWGFLTFLAAKVCSWGMDTKNIGTFDLDNAWPGQMCRTLQDYLQEAYGRLNQTGCAHAFRGVTRHFDNLRSSFDRRDTTAGNPVEIETWLLEEFLHRGVDHLTPQERQRYLLAETRWGTRRNTGSLVVARHRMVPTRCIDWTYCPLCALLFACASDSDCDGEVWWFNRVEFDACVGAQWPVLFGKPNCVEDDIERDFIGGCDGRWFTALGYMLLPGDRPCRQKAWITVAGRLGVCHANEIHRIGVREKGRLAIPARLKAEAIALLGQMGITKESLGFGYAEPADEIARQIVEDSNGRFPREAIGESEEDSRI